MDLAKLKARAIGGPVLQQVRVDFTDEELAALKSDLAKNELLLDDAIEVFAEIRTAHNTEKKEMQAHSKLIKGDIRRRYVDVEKEVLLVPDYESGTMSIYRADTGELVNTRKLHPTERQAEMAL